jgi:uncharacterized protein YciI
MKNFNLITIPVLFVLAAAACSSSEQTTELQKQEQQKADSTANDSLVFNPALAAELGADEFGMKSYFFVFLTKGETQISDSAERLEIQKAHLANIRKLRTEKKLVLAGPFLNEENLRGLLIFDSDSLQEVQRLTESDPAVEAGVLNYKMTQWYGPAALLKVYAIHPKAAKIEI